jgi:hypothetical protein
LSLILISFPVISSHSDVLSFGVTRWSGRCFFFPFLLWEEEWLPPRRRSERKWEIDVKIKIKSGGKTIRIRWNWRRASPFLKIHMLRAQFLPYLQNKISSGPEIPIPMLYATYAIFRQA